MAVTYKNNWKNILTALKSKIRAEIKCPIFSNINEKNKSNQFIQLIPTGSEQGDVTRYSEHRTFNINIQYYMMNSKSSDFQNYMLNQVSMLEALIHENPTLLLADNKTAFNLMIGDLDFTIEPEEEYENYIIAGWSFSCEHLSNLG